MNFILDTDTSSAYLKGNRAVGRRYMQFSGRVALSIITVAELTAWARRARTSREKRLSIERFVNESTVIDVDRRIADKFGEIRSQQYDTGRLTPDLDLLIAATAIVHDATLVTHNTADFEDIPGLMMADWLDD